MRQELRLEQKLVLTPQLLLNLRLLALPSVELEQVVRQEIEKNPSLEELPEPEEEEREEMIEERRKGEEREADEFSYADLLPEDSIHTETPREETSEFEDFVPPAPGVTPVEMVATLVRAKLPKEDFPYAEYILQSLDEDGFLLLSQEELEENLGISKERLARILQLIKSIEPGGIASTNKQEAFLAQLSLKGFPPDSDEVKIMERCYDAFLKMDEKRIAAELKIERQAVKKAIANLKFLEPRPLRQYGATSLSYVEPDFEVRFSGDSFSIVFRDERIPHLRISSYYREVLKNPSSYSQEEVEFARQKVRDALTVIKAIEARKVMLTRVVSYIVEKEREFFRGGGLTPLTVKELAKDLGLHPSSVSRAIMRKYLSTPTGIFPLRYFFSSGIGEKSSLSIKARVKELIAQEDPSSPLTDEEIVLRLRSEGVDIARRTVVKYRQELKILPSHLRKR